MQELLDNLVKINLPLTHKGKVANYIPALARADIDNLGVCVIDMSGNSYASGDYRTLFTIQSISKTISFMLALLDTGEEKVFTKVGMEATGDRFNSIYKLETADVSKPLNPMINAGAIAVCSLIKGRNGEEKFERLLNLFKKITGNKELKVNEEVYRSEKETGNKNRAMAYLLKDMGILEENPEEILNVYFKQCSIEVSCVDIAKIGLLLANEGRLPFTGEEIASKRIARIIKTFMVTCGMYDASGEFAIEVGIPAKSGVGGGIMASVPHKMGIGAYGPSLDNKGNSVGAWGILEGLSAELNLSIF